MVRQKLAADIEKVLAPPEVKATFDTLCMERPAQAPARFDSFIAKEQDKWSKVIGQAGIEPNRGNSDALPHKHWREHLHRSSPSYLE